MSRWLKGRCALLAGADTPTAKFFINCLAEPAEEVAQYLVPRIRKVPQEARSIGGSMSQVRGPRLERFVGSVRRDRAWLRHLWLVAPQMSIKTVAQHLCLV